LQLIRGEVRALPGAPASVTSWQSGRGKRRARRSGWRFYARGVADQSAVRDPAELGGRPDQPVLPRAVVPRVRWRNGLPSRASRTWPASFPALTPPHGPVPH